MKLQYKLQITTALAVACSALLGCSRQQPEKKELAQKRMAEIVAVYQIPGGAWETCLKFEDGSRSLWTTHKLGEAGDKLPIWKNSKGNEWLSDPN